MVRRSIRRADRPAVSHADFSEIGREALSVFSPGALREEIAVLRTVLCLPETASPPDDMEEDEWHEIVTGLLSRLGAVVESGRLRAWARSATQRERQAISARLDQVLRAVDDGALSVDEFGSATGALLPTSLARRVELLVGKGCLPLAWIRPLDVLRF